MYNSHCPNPTYKRMQNVTCYGHCTFPASFKQCQPTSIYFTWHLCCVCVCMCTFMFTCIKTMFVLVGVQMNVEARSCFQISSSITLFYWGRVSDLIWSWSLWVAQLLTFSGDPISFSQVLGYIQTSISNWLLSGRFRSKLQFPVLMQELYSFSLKFLILTIFVSHTYNLRKKYHKEIFEK